MPCTFRHISSAPSPIIHHHAAWISPFHATALVHAPQPTMVSLHVDGARPSRYGSLTMRASIPNNACNCYCDDSMVWSAASAQCGQLCVACSHCSSVARISGPAGLVTRSVTVGSFDQCRAQFNAARSWPLFSRRLDAFPAYIGPVPAVAYSLISEKQLVNNEKVLPLYEHEYSPNIWNLWIANDMYTSSCLHVIIYIFLIVTIGDTIVQKHNILLYLSAACNC